MAGPVNLDARRRGEDGNSDPTSQSLSEHGEHPVGPLVSDPFLVKHAFKLSFRRSTWQCTLVSSKSPKTGVAKSAHAKIGFLGAPVHFGFSHVHRFLIHNMMSFTMGYQKETSTHAMSDLLKDLRPHSRHDSGTGRVTSRSSATSPKNCIVCVDRSTVSILECEHDMARRNCCSICH